MASVQELDLPRPIESEITSLRNWLIFVASLKTTAWGAEVSAKQLEDQINSIAQRHSPERIAEALIATVPDVPKKHGDHYHWVIYQDGPERHGPLVTLSQIEPYSNQNPTEHEHSNCIEVVLPLNDGLVSKVTENGQPETYPLEPLSAFSIPKGVTHSDFNEGGNTVYYVILRRQLF